MIKSIWSKQPISAQEYAKDILIEHLKELLDYKPDPRVRKVPFALENYLHGEKALSEKERREIFDELQKEYMKIRLQIYNSN